MKFTNDNITIYGFFELIFDCELMAKMKDTKLPRDKFLDYVNNYAKFDNLKPAKIGNYLKLIETSL